MDAAPPLLTRKKWNRNSPCIRTERLKAVLESRARARGVTLAKIEPAERAAIPLGRFAEPGSGLCRRLPGPGRGVLPR